MTSEMLNMAHYDVRDGKKCSFWHQRWSKTLFMTAEMVKMDHNDARDGQKKIIMTSEMIKMTSGLVRNDNYDVRYGQNSSL